MRHTMSLFILSAALVATAYGAAGRIDPALQAKIQARIPTIKAWAADPAVVQAVKAANAAANSEHAAMTQKKWAETSVLDPFVRGLTKNDAAVTLKGKKTEEVTEAFLSSADGCKVAFLSKPTNWSHKGKPKHDVPMAGRIWQGQIEVDESTGMQQIQVAVPVMDGGRPIGSLVVGLAVSKLR